MATTYDLVIIGAGSAGLSSADFALRLGAKAALVEKDRIGGDCTWSGCVPSKALLAAAATSETLESAGAPPLSFSEAMARVDSARSNISAGETPDVLTGKGVDVFIGAGRFLDPHTLEAGSDTLKGRNFLISTGAVPSIPPVPGLDSVRYLTYLELFELKEMPGRLVIMGGGPIGIEMAQAFARLGSRVTVVEMSERILPLEEPEASELIEARLKSEGVTLLTGARAREVRADDGGIVVDTGDVQAQGDALLVATGRRDDTSGLGLDAAGVAVGDRGITVDRFLRTNQYHIFAAGDVTGSYQFTHFAGRQAVIATRNALLPGLQDASKSAMAWATFTDPEVARVGMSEAQAREEHGGSIEVTLLPFSNIDRAVLAGKSEGFVKVVRRRSLLRGGLLGATVVGERAGELIHEWVLACNGKVSLGDLASVIHVYPSYSMANQQAAIEIQAGKYLGGWKSRLIKNYMKASRWSRRG